MRHPIVMKSTSYVKMAHEHVIGEDVYKKLTQIMSTQMSIPVSRRYNALYDEKDLHRSLMELSVNNSYAESGMKRLIEESGGTRVPAGYWLRDTVEAVDPVKMISMLEDTLRSTLGQIMKHHVLDMPVMAAIDKHGIPRYDAGTDGGLLTRSKHERGTSMYETYITLQSVEEGRRAQIACKRVNIFSEDANEITALLDESKVNGIEISLLLMDREFFSCAVIERLRHLHQRFLIPCKLTVGIKEALREYSEGSRHSTSNYNMGSGENMACFTLVILPRANAESDELEEKYIPFATNMSIGEILWNVSRLPKEYRMRWGIETGYNGVEQFRARTTSRNHSLRTLYFYYALILSNAWLLANLDLVKKFTMPFRVIIHIQLLKGIFHKLYITGRG